MPRRMPIGASVANQTLQLHQKLARSALSGDGADRITECRYRRVRFVIRSIVWRLAVALAVVLPISIEGETAMSQTPERLILELESGQVEIRLRPDLAPSHVERIVALADQGFYDGIVWHRVIPGFMAQTGDPTGTGRGGSDLPDLRAEFTDQETYGRGTIGMARTPQPHTANSQFFICFEDCSFLDGQYTIWGEVTSGMELVDGLATGEPPANPDQIVRMRSAP